MHIYGCLYTDVCMRVCIAYLHSLTVVSFLILSIFEFKSNLFFCVLYMTIDIICLSKLELAKTTNASINCQHKNSPKEIKQKN